MRPLRAYLMIRLGTGEWQVSVCRDLEGVFDAWFAHSDRSTITGVLHLGFDRPDTQLLDDVARSCAGRMLLTPSAKFGLPAEFALTGISKGTVAGIPLYLSLKGWGYTIEDDEVASETAPEPTALGSLPDLPSGWLLKFVGEHPSTHATLHQAGIHDEQTYWNLESKLERPLRIVLAQFRVREKCNGLEATDPTEIARAAPPWLAAREVDTLALTVRLSNVFQRESIKTVDDIARYQLQELLRLTNFGRTSQRDLITLMLAALAEGPEVEEVQLESAAGVSLIEGLNISMRGMAERDRDILASRMGLGQRAETLEQIGRRYGVTRERIRQIETKIIKRLIREAFWDDLLISKLENLLAGRVHPLPVHGIEALDPWFSGVAETGHALRYILREICGGRLFVIEAHGIHYFSRIGQEEWNDAVRQARRILKSAAADGWSEQHCRSAVGSIVKSRAPEVADLIWEQVQSSCLFTNMGGERIFVGYGRGLEPLVHAVLAESDSPLHYDEITRRVNERADAPVDNRKVHGLAGEIGWLLGRGTFGLPQHVPISPEEIRTLCADAEEIIASDPSRQWHCAELVQALFESGLIDRPEIDKYVVDAVLRTSTVAQGLGRLTWTVAGDAGEQVSRIEVLDAIVRVLEQAGRPLSNDEIRKRVEAIRGTNTAFQFWPVAPLVRVGPRLWGLNDRDVPVKKARQREFFDQMVSALNASGAGIHETELAAALDIPAGVELDVLLALATHDARLRVSRDRHLYLAEWGETRRQSVSDVAATVLRKADAGLSTDVLAIEVESVIGRQISRDRLSRALQGSEARFCPATRTWSLSCADDLEEEEEEQDQAQDAVPSSETYLMPSELPAARPNIPEETPEARGAGNIPGADDEPSAERGVYGAPEGDQPRFLKWFKRAASK